MLSSKIMEICKDVESFSDSAVLVEGINDKTPLLKIGFKNIHTISGKPLESFVNELTKYKSFIILTDLDEEGEEKAEILAKMLQAHGKVNRTFRYKLKSFFKIHKIEELNSIVKDINEINSADDKMFNRNRFLSRQR